jgi:hypothetical protein
MVGVKETEQEIKLLVRKNLPSAKVARIGVEDSSDSEGQPSLSIRVIFRTKPPKKELQKTDTLVDAFRTWLSEKGDDRFPYFSFLTLKDEKELSA